MNDYFERAESLQKKLENGENEAEIRDELQNMFNNIFIGKHLSNGQDIEKKTTDKIMSSLKALSNLQSLKCDMKTIYKCNISKICDNITFSSDLLLSEWGKRIRFYCDEEIFVKCSAKWLIWSILSVISNAVIYSSKKDIIVTLSQDADFAIVSILNFGKCNLDNIFESLNEKGKSLNSVDHFIECSKGKMLFCCDNEKTNIIMKIPKYIDEDLLLYNSYDFSEFLSDRLSPLYIALSDICF
ncbi:MAG: hypothetical protein RR229_02460 [Oscillospiraceae bacterium]